MMIMMHYDMIRYVIQCNIDSDPSCDSNTSRKTSHIWPKGFDGLVRWLFRRIDIEMYHKSLMETQLMMRYKTTR